MYLPSKWLTRMTLWSELENENMPHKTITDDGVDSIGFPANTNNEVLVQAIYSQSFGGDLEFTISPANISGYTEQIW